METMIQVNELTKVFGSHCLRRMSDRLFDGHVLGSEESGLQNYREYRTFTCLVQADLVDNTGVHPVERIEPVVWFAEERIAFQLCECTHIDISAFQL